MDTKEADSAIQQFYRGRKVLVTGATGFMGKVLIEKLLRCTAVSTIYMLVRCKKGKTVQQRTAELFDDMLFSRLKSEVCDYQSRVRVVEGDVSLPGLGLRSEDTLLLQAEVEVVLHSAASVRFDETLERALLINVKGTKSVLQLARTCTNLKAFVHISTAYANCTQSEVYEDFFEPPMTGDNAIQLTECLSDQQLTDIARPLCGEYPNTYAFSKALAENVVKVHGQGLPVVVFRPAIVVATAKEPISGWTDNVYGPTGVQCGVGSGVLRTFQVNESCTADLVPVDMAANGVIASAWDISQNRCQDDMPVYNYVSSCQNRLVWGQFIEMSLRWGRHTPTSKALWCYTMVSSKFHLVYLVYRFLLHMLPALLVDSVLLVTGKKPRMWNIYKKVHKFSGVIAYFSTRQWRFHNTRVVQLWQRMSEKDQKLFYFDIATLDWDQFFKDNIWWLRNNFFQDFPETLSEARRKQFRFRVLNYVLEVLLIALIVWVLWNVIALSRFYYLFVTTTTCIAM